MTLSEFATQIKALDAALPQVASNIASTAVMVGLTDLVNVTPVDTGQAISNWQVTLNDPPTTALPPYVPSPKGHKEDMGVTRDANVQPTLEAATSALQAKLPGQVIHLANVLPYIVPLNNGTSTQAPAGFVERSTLLIEDYVNNAQATI